ncbi:patatin-like phospholipase family protein [Mycobacterium hodleri]|uniref:Patatin-like phospholipase family protein n=1 Tax=Mycolicibacterium hodleri TaxID=49897 RepID=A0A544W5N6_9MYCO|nr:patatin-like phospholipase family protein [Mycolicibacterium hodleri]
MVTAFVLSGGGSLGAVQAGMLLSLFEAGVVPDIIVGTSVGAFNGGWVAARPDVAGTKDLIGVWRSLSRRDVFPTHLGTSALCIFGLRRHLASGDGIRRILRQHLRFQLLQDAPTPFHCVATDVLSGEDVLLSAGDAADAIAASAAIPAILPPVRIGGRDLMDGGVVNNTPLSHAVRLGADIIYVLPTGYACALQSAPRGALGLAMHAMTIAINQRLANDVERFAAIHDWLRRVHSSVGQALLLEPHRD